MPLKFLWIKLLINYLLYGMYTDKSALSVLTIYMNVQAQEGDCV